MVYTSPHPLLTHSHHTNKITNTHNQYLLTDVYTLTTQNGVVLHTPNYKLSNAVTLTSSLVHPYPHPHTHSTPNALMDSFEANYKKINIKKKNHCDKDILKIVWNLKSSQDRF